MATGWPLVGHWMAIGWPLVGHSLAVGWPLVGHWLAIGWPLVGHWLAIGWPLAGHWLAIGRILIGHWLAIGSWILLAGHWRQLAIAALCVPGTSLSSHDPAKPAKSKQSRPKPTKARQTQTKPPGHGYLNRQAMASNGPPTNTGNYIDASLRVFVLAVQAFCHLSRSI